MTTIQMSDGRIYDPKNLAVYGPDDPRAKPKAKPKRSRKQRKRERFKKLGQITVLLDLDSDLLEWWCELAARLHEHAVRADIEFRQQHGRYMSTADICGWYTRFRSTDIVHGLPTAYGRAVVSAVVQARIAGKLSGMKQFDRKPYYSLKTSGIGNVHLVLEWAPDDMRGPVSFINTGIRLPGFRQPLQFSDDNSDGVAGWLRTVGEKVIVTNAWLWRSKSDGRWRCRLSHRQRRRDDPWQSSKIFDRMEAEDRVWREAPDPDRARDVVADVFREHDQARSGGYLKVATILAEAEKRGCKLTNHTLSLFLFDYSSDTPRRPASRVKKIGGKATRVYLWSQVYAALEVTARYRAMMREGEGAAEPAGYTSVFAR